MKKFLVCFVVCAAAASFLVACESAPVEPTKSVSAFDPSFSNGQLKKVSVEGFATGSAAVPAQQWDTWAKNAAPVVKSIISSLPNGYSFQITGHADTTGSESASGSFVGNKALSENRAVVVYNALKKAGITSPRMTYKGVGSSDPISGVAGDDGAQRRVSFQVVASK